MRFRPLLLRCHFPLLVATPRCGQQSAQRRGREEPMLNENNRAIRKSRGLSQEELAIRLNVVRQTVSKWRWILKPAALSG
ncbi:helix-turn-helix transcriptional regulator [uncultured Parolsenella sp.]|uniref:helix-turn-helix transcriptional regulator n=1 Tax=uncultured Parolsenella sp. TaxID=2083008 RepID=UPI00345634F1